MTSEQNEFYSSSPAPAEYFNHLLSSKAEIHETLLRKVVGEEVWSRQRELEEMTLTSQNVDIKGFVSSIVSIIDSEHDVETPESEERDTFVSVEDALIDLEREYLDGFIIATDDTTPYLIRRADSQLIVDPITHRPSVVKFVEFVTTSPDGTLQREWYSSTAGNCDYNESILSGERQNAAKSDEGLDFHQSPLEEGQSILLFTALENLNFRYCQLLEMPRDRLVQDLLN